MSGARLLDGLFHTSNRVLNEVRAELTTESIADQGLGERLAIAAKPHVSIL